MRSRVTLNSLPTSSSVRARPSSNPKRSCSPRRRDLPDRRLAAQLLQQATRYADEPVDRLHHVHGDADRARLVGDGAGDGLPDPPRGVGRELVALLVVELLDRPDEADVPLLDEIQEAHP